MKFTACYTKLEHGYMGQLLEWPGVITEGDDLDDCRDCLIEVAGEMAEIYKEDGLKIPSVSLKVETIDVPIEDLQEEALLANVG